MPKLPTMTLKDGPAFGEYLRDLRKTGGMSARDLASSLGVSTTYLCDVERGAKPLAVQHLYRAAEVLDVERATLQAVAARTLLKAKGLWADD